jgi:hypothetical protein
MSAARTAGTCASTLRVTKADAIIELQRGSVSNVASAAATASDHEDTPSTLSTVGRQGWSDAPRFDATVVGHRPCSRCHAPIASNTS